jgi:hypothetical protein
MELFAPALLVLVLGAIVCFVILPKASPYILGILAIVMFFIGAWQHYSMFPYEYRMSYFTDLLRAYAPFVMLIAVIFGGLTATMLAFGVSPPNIASVLPDAVTNILPANNSKPANNATKVANNATKTTNNANNTRRNNIASSSFKTV